MSCDIQMSSFGDSVSVFDGRASQFATMRHSHRVFSDPAIAHYAPSTSLPGDAHECHSVPVTPVKCMSSNQIARRPPPPEPPGTNSRFSVPRIGKPTA
jgi:hypothetical protein